MRDTAQRDKLKAASVRFLGNVKAQFGELSSQVYDVHKTLDLFSKQELSKREAHKTILDTLEGYDDLRQELMDILKHPAARWGPDDFDLPTQHATRLPLEPAPQSLQSAHEPLMRLPSFSSSWFPLPQVDHSASFTMFNGYNGFSGQQSSASSPSLPIPPPFRLPNPPTHLWTDADADTPYAELHGDEFVPPPVQTAFRNPWENSTYTNTWTNNGIDYPSNDANIGGHFEVQEPPAFPYNDDIRASLAYPQYTESYTTPTMLQREGPQSLHNPHPTYDKLLSSTNHDPIYTVDLEERHLTDPHALPTPSSQSPPSVQQTENAGEAAEAAEAEQPTERDRNHSPGEPFRHNLCGKGFATLSGVKKHHWGKKVNDLATMTGCWAKYKKPDVAWDDHPSCREKRSASGVIRALPPTSKQSESKATNLIPGTPTAVHVPQLITIPGFPISEDLPHTVARPAVSATVPSLQEPKPVYHTRRLPSRSSFDSLLTAVNVVSQIDAPKPQGRTESIALHLDAQVAAAEQHDSFTAYEPPTSSFKSPHVRHIAPAALNTTGGTNMGGLLNHISEHLVNYGSGEQPSVLPSDVEKSHVAAAFSRPFRHLGASSSGPARKKRKV